MKRLLVLATVVAVSLPATAATVSGRVNFVTKKGQNTVISETLVWLEPLGGHMIRRPAGSFSMVTRNKTLIPHVLAIPVGSTVSFPNDDPISHNLFSLSGPASFDLGLYRKGTGKTHRFDTPGTVNVYCNVHPNMAAVIQVMPNTWYAFTDGRGNFAIENVPAGRYRLTAWNEQGGQTVENVSVGASGVAVVAVTLDSRNYRGTQHMNKEGKPYSLLPRDY